MNVPPPPDPSPSWPEAEGLDPLVHEVYAELRELARRYFRRERVDHTLQPTALVHEVYLRLAGGEQSRWADRNHFYRVAAIAMRHVLVNHARDRKRLRRAGSRRRVSLETALELSTEGPDPDLVPLDEALRKLVELSPRSSQLVDLHYFAGLSLDEAASALGISASTAKREWRFAKAWLRRELEGRGDDRGPA